MVEYLSFDILYLIFDIWCEVLDYTLTLQRRFDLCYFKFDWVRDLILTLIFDILCLFGCLWEKSHKMLSILCYMCFLSYSFYSYDFSHTFFVIWFLSYVFWHKIYRIHYCVSYICFLKHLEFSILKFYYEFYWVYIFLHLYFLVDYSLIEFLLKPIHLLFSKHSF